jgi:hypothetical protein
MSVDSDFTSAGVRCAATHHPGAAGAPVAVLFFLRRALDLPASATVGGLR